MCFCAHLKLYIYLVLFYHENDLDKHCRNLDIKGRNMFFTRSFGQICWEFPWHYCLFSSLKIAHMSTSYGSYVCCIKFWQHCVSVPKQQGIWDFAEICTDYHNLPAFADKYSSKLAFDARIPLEALILCHLLKSFVFNYRCHHLNYLSTNDLVNQ